MGDVITVEGLSKRYVLGAQRKGGYQTFREAMMQRARRLFPGKRDSDAEQATREFWALQDVSFSVREGDRVGIIGRNGAGKSTLLKILSRITEPTRGRVAIRGRVASLLEVGTGFHPELTGRENIFLNGAILGMSRNEVRRKFDAIVDFASVEKFLDTPVKRYSSGMYVRLAFAVAAHLEPDILIVDEVLAVGDAEFQKKCLDQLENQRNGGRTVLFVSHNMNAVEKLCNTALVMSGGLLTLQTMDVRAAVHSYLLGDSGGNGGLWVNRGEEFANEWFKPLRFSVCDDTGAVIHQPVRGDSDIWVQIEADVGVQDSALTVGYALYADSNDLLYWSYQTDAERIGSTMASGRRVLRSKLPKRFLNEGNYRLELIGGLHFRQWLFEPGVNAPQVHLEVRGGLSDSPYWMARRPGILAPVLDWSVE